MDNQSTPLTQDDVTTNTATSDVANNSNKSELDSPKSSNAAKIIITILVMLLIAASGAAVYLYQQNRMFRQNIADLTTVPTIVEPESSNLSEISLNDPTAGWQTYTNSQYEFSTKYAPDSPPTETIGNEQVGQFTYLFKVDFGTNPLKSPYGYTIEVNQDKTLENYRQELVGHITDTIDSQQTQTINDIIWTMLYYQQFIATGNIPVTLAFTTYNGYGYALTAATTDITPILSTFKFLNE